MVSHSESDLQMVGVHIYLYLISIYLYLIFIYVLYGCFLEGKMFRASFGHQQFRIQDMVCWCPQLWLVSGFEPLKNLRTSVEMMTFPNWMESHKIPWFQSPPIIYIYISPFLLLKSDIFWKIKAMVPNHQSGGLWGMICIDQKSHRRHVKVTTCYHQVAPSDGTLRDKVPQNDDFEFSWPLDFRMF